jgi:hypothetical protein
MVGLSQEIKRENGRGGDVEVHRILREALRFDL